MTTETSKLYVDIQSLLDIRQSVIIDILGEESAAEFISSDEYNFRESDVFSSKIDMNLFSSKMKTTDPSILKNTTVTYLEVVLKSKLANLEKRNTFYGINQKPEVILNVYPFKFNEKEIRILQNALFLKLESGCMVTIVCEPVKVWSPLYIKHNNVVAFFMYDVKAWMDEHSAKLANGELRETMMYFPALGYKDLTPEDIKQIRKLGFKDIFSYTEYLLSSVMQLNFLPVVFYTNIITATAHLDKYSKGMVGKSVQELQKET